MLKKTGSPASILDGSPISATSPITPRISAPLPNRDCNTPRTHMAMQDPLVNGSTSFTTNNGQLKTTNTSGSSERRGSMGSRRSRSSLQQSQHGWLWVGEEAVVATMPSGFFDNHISQLAQLVSRMLRDIVEINDHIPFDPDKLTRFHSRAPPGISIRDYILRIIRFCNIDKVILVVLLYFIDLFSKSYNEFNINTLTVHRFIITGVTVASKGLCDTYCENTFYAKVGGLSVVELNLLEVEFLTRVNYRVVPRPGLLVEYYKRLVEREAAVMDADGTANKEDTVSALPVIEQTPTNRKHARSCSPSPGASGASGTLATGQTGLPANYSDTPTPPPAAEPAAKATLKSTMKRFLHPAKKKKADTAD